MDKQESKQAKDTEQLILEAAITEFSTKGFDGAHINDSSECWRDPRYATLLFSH